MMSLNVFMAVCVLGMDFLIYVLFQWTYGDKRRVLQKQLAEQRKAMKGERSRPFVVPSNRGGGVRQTVKERMAGAA
jgi:hypothetical protein